MKNVILSAILTICLCGGAFAQTPKPSTKAKPSTSTAKKSTTATKKDVVEVAIASPDHTTLVTAVQAAGLTETLKGKGPFTIFAPTNQAFEKLMADQSSESMNRMQQDDMQSDSTGGTYRNNPDTSSMQEGNTYQNRTMQNDPTTDRSRTDRTDAMNRMDTVPNSGNRTTQTQPNRPMRDSLTTRGGVPKTQPNTTTIRTDSTRYNTQTQPNTNMRRDTMSGNYNNPNRTQPNMNTRRDTTTGNYNNPNRTQPNNSTRRDTTTSNSSNWNSNNNTTYNNTQTQPNTTTRRDTTASNSSNMNNPSSSNPNWNNGNTNGNTPVQPNRTTTTRRDTTGTSMNNTTSGSNPNWNNANTNGNVQTQPNMTTPEQTTTGMDRTTALSQLDTVPNRNTTKQGMTSDTWMQPENKTQLSSILTYHVVRGNFDSNALKQAIKAGNGKAELTTVNGAKLTAMLQGSDIYLQDTNGNSAKVTAADLKGSNGVIHVIDSVVMPDKSMSSDK